MTAIQTETKKVIQIEKAYYCILQSFYDPSSPFGMMEPGGADSIGICNGFGN
jgi:hypothetical protein